eukprot:scaffold2557_cov121-Cylindrotheca_fusiformis.AAC.39
MKAPALLFCLFIIIVGSLSFKHGWSFPAKNIQKTSSSSWRQRRASSTVLRYDTSSDEDHVIELPAISNATKNGLYEWLYSLPKLERSEPDWIQQDLLTFSPSALLQEQLSQLCPNTSINLFETVSSRAAFDFHWRSMVLKSIPSMDLPEVLRAGRSNSHPLRLQLIAIPPHCNTKLHAHAAVEVAVPLLGVYCQRRTEVLLARDQFWRSPEHAIGTPLSNFSEIPLPEETTMIREDLSRRAFFPNGGRNGRFSSECLGEGHCLVNKVGSVHQSYTSDSPCLLWVFGPNVQAHFLPGNFSQTEGIDDLTDIYDNDI